MAIIGTFLLITIANDRNLGSVAQLHAAIKDGGRVINTVLPVDVSGLS